MSRYLLDVNVLVALADQSHVHHEPASSWFRGNGSRGWASCDVTQNGFLRVLLSSRYPWPSNRRDTVLSLFREVFSHPAHKYLAEGASLLDRRLFRLEALEGHRQVTDVYLLGLAIRSSCRLATFDQSVRREAVVGGASAIELIR